MHDISEVAQKSEYKMLCVGCGRNDGLIAPIKDKKGVLWCMRCGTLTDSENTPVDSLVPQLCTHTLSALGVSSFESEARKAAGEKEPQEENQASSLSPPTN